MPVSLLVPYYVSNKDGNKMILFHNGYVLINNEYKAQSSKCYKAFATQLRSWGSSHGKRTLGTTKITCAVTFLKKNYNWK